MYFLLKTTYNEKLEILARVFFTGACVLKRLLFDLQTSELRQNVYHVERRPKAKKPEPPKNSIYLATKAALEKKNVDSCE